MLGWFSLEDISVRVAVQFPAERKSIEYEFESFFRVGSTPAAVNDESAVDMSGRLEEKRKSALR